MKNKMEMRRLYLTANETHLAGILTKNILSSYMLNVAWISDKRVRLMQGSDKCLLTIVLCYNKTALWIEKFYQGPL